ncbi:hypothetical protein BDZ91DRAFT_238075 [Kalaharituber pfeilii]|nr:hypothetical protein BDZ91DRAFT_238075 [Kalaharituber pfeilii]
MKNISALRPAINEIKKKKKKKSALNRLCAQTIYPAFSKEPHSSLELAYSPPNHVNCCLTLHFTYIPPNHPAGPNQRPPSSSLSSF